MRKILLFILPFLIVCTSIQAQDFDDQKLLEDLGITADEEKEEHRFPAAKSEINLFTGYRLLDVDGSAKASEYEYLKDSPVIGGELQNFFYPHRLSLDFNLDNTRDHFADAYYAYRCMVIAKWLHRNLFHNLENIELADLAPASNNYKIDIRDRDDEYGVRSGMDNFLLRLKAPDYPGHAFIRGLHVVREGSQQQRSLLGSGYFQNIKRVTRDREADWNTQNYEIGANSHMGIAEVELSHMEKRFDVRKNEVLHDAYEASAFRPAGVFPHNRLPEFKGSSNIIKIHTLYTEQLVASATFSVKERENKTSGPTAEEFRGTGSLQWTPLTRLSLFLKYSHMELDVDNPGTASITEMSGAVTTYPNNLKPSVSKTSDVISLTGRYKPESHVTLKAKYILEDISRENAEDWNLQDSTRKNSLILSADMRAFKRVNIKTEYVQKVVVNPSYNTEPDYSNKGSASVSWMPSAGVNLLVNYSITSDKRDDLSFTETEGARDRTARTDNLMGSGTFQVFPNLSFTASYAYLRYKVKQDIVYDSLGNVPFVDPDVPMTNTAHVYAASVNYVPVDKLFLMANASYSQGEEKFKPRSRELLEPVSVASFSEKKLSEAFYHVSGEYKFRNGLSGLIDVEYRDFNDVLDNIYDSDQDGDVYMIMLRIKKIWG